MQIRDFQNSIFSLLRPKSKFWYAGSFVLVPRTKNIHDCQVSRLYFKNSRMGRNLKKLWQIAIIKVPKCNEIVCILWFQNLITFSRDNIYSYRKQFLVDAVSLYIIQNFFAKKWPNLELNRGKLISSHKCCIIIIITENLYPA